MLARASQKDCSARRDTHAVVTLACSLHGRKRGFHVAATLLRRSERWVHGFRYHDQGALPAPEAVHAALMTLRRQRAAQLRAELNAMEADDFADEMVARAGAGSGICG